MKTNFDSLTRLAIFAFAVSMCTSRHAAAQDSKTKQESAAKPVVLAIRGGDIHTVTQGTIRQGTILITDGKITEIGNDVEIPDAATVIDATGKTITPGFVAIGMQGIALRESAQGQNKIEDQLDPFDQNIKYALGVGITTGCAEMSSGRGRGRRRSPGTPQDRFPGFEQPAEEYLTEAMLDYGDPNTALCPCCGLPVLPTEPITPTAPTAAQPRQMTVIKMAYGNLDSMLTQEEVFYNPSPGALNGALNRHNWRIELEKAKAEIKAEKEKGDKTAAPTESKPSPATTPAAGGPGGRRPAGGGRPTTRGGSPGGAGSANSKAKPEVVQLLKGETRMRIQANSLDEINDLTDMAQEYGYGLVIEGGTEAWVVIDRLSSAGVQMIYTPRNRREPQPGREDNSGSRFESPGMFETAGIPFATAALSNSISMGGLAGRDLSSLPLEAAFAVRGGASEKAALESITIVPARMMGLDDRIGSIEVGKDADLLILNGEPLDYKTYVEKAIVAGKLSYDRNVDQIYPVYERE